MLKRAFAAITAAFGLSMTAVADDQFALGSSTFSIPAGWTEKSKTDERLTFVAPDGGQQATVSLMSFGITPSFEDFKRICSVRYKAEKEGLDDLLLQPDSPAPLEKEGRYEMYFSGKEKKTDRIFSGLLSLKGKELIAIYVEGIGVTSTKHLESFKIFESSLKRQ